MKISYAQIEDGSFNRAWVKYARHLPLSLRKKAAAISAAVLEFMKAGQRHKESAIFTYGKPAPEGWPNAGQIVIEPSLLTAEEYEALKSDFEALRAGVIEVDWPQERPTLALPPAVAAELELEDITALEILVIIPD